jgi:hypothetical protein
VFFGGGFERKRRPGKEGFMGNLMRWSVVGLVVLEFAASADGAGLLRRRGGNCCPAPCAEACAVGGCATACQPACQPQFQTVERTIMVPEWGTESRTVTETACRLETRETTHTVMRPVAVQKQITREVCIQVP